MNRIIRVFLRADMRCSHRGLTRMANENEIDITKLERGEFVLFINNDRNRIKLYAPNNVIAYLSLPKGKIDLRTIALIPKSFSATGKIEYDEALKEVLLKEIARKKNDY